MAMEKRNTIELGRTPCKKSLSSFCDCDQCKKSGVKQAEEKQVNINDIDSLAKAHK